MESCHYHDINDSAQWVGSWPISFTFSFAKGGEEVKYFQLTNFGKAPRQDIWF